MTIGPVQLVLVLVEGFEVSIRLRQSMRRTFRLVLT